MMNCFKCFFLLLAYLLLSTALAKAQTLPDFQLYIDAENTLPKGIIQEKQPLLFQNTKDAQEFVAKVIEGLKGKGYLSANLDAWVLIEGGAQASIHAGAPWTWQLHADSSVYFIWDKLKISRQARASSIAQSEVVEGLAKKTRRYCENHGFPFAQTQWAFEPIDSLAMRATLHLNKGLPITFDTLRMQGEPIVKQRFLANYLQIYPDQPFNQKRLEDAQIALSQLPYLSLQKPLQTAFLFDKAFPVLFLQKQEASSINGVIGLLLDPARQQRPIITGELALRLLNPFGGGRRLQLSYRRLKVASQQLAVGYSQPNLLGTRFDISTDFQYFKEDSTYLNLQASMELSYRISYYSQWLVKLTTQDHRLDSRIASQPTSFTEFGSTTYNAYGMGYRYQHFDNLWLPRYGWRIEGLLQAGNKSLRPVLAIDDPTYASTYGNFPLKTVQWQWNLQIEKFWKISQPLSIRFQGKGEGLFSRLLFQNDLFRIGGLQSLRGFNENFFFASNYWVNTLEGRIHFGKEGYISLFLDQAYVQYRTSTRGITEDWPIGTGLGLSFGTQAGLFTFAYALGSSQSQALDFRTAKVHFGLTGKF